MSNIINLFTREELEPEEVLKTLKTFNDITEAARDIADDYDPLVQYLIVGTHESRAVSVRASEGLTKENAYYLLGLAQDLAKHSHSEEE